MMKGFSLLELLVVLAICTGLLALLISAVFNTVGVSRRVISNHEKMESIFITIDMVRSDLTRCGARLQEAKSFLPFHLFEYTRFSFKVTYGTAIENLTSDAALAEKMMVINRNDFFTNGKKIILFDPETGHNETNEIIARKGDQLTLADNLQAVFPKNSVVVALKEVEYKVYSQEGRKILKRKINKGYFQPLLENVTNFFVYFYPEANSVFYMVEVGYREQVRGYVFLTNMTEMMP